VPDKINQTLQSLPVANYDPAIASALEWLGDRYLLAKPIMPSDSAVKVSVDDGHEQPHQGARYHHLFDMRRGEPQS
jgi:hypothetical protein